MHCVPVALPEVKVGARDVSAENIQFEIFQERR